MDVAKILEQVDSVSLVGLNDINSLEEVFWDAIEPVVVDMENRKNTIKIKKFMSSLLVEDPDISGYPSQKQEMIKSIIMRGGERKYESVDFRKRFKVKRFWFAFEACLYMISLFEDRYDNLNVKYTKSMKQLRRINSMGMSPQKATKIKCICIQIVEDFYNTSQQAKMLKT